jgi:hypothetical protein
MKDGTAELKVRVVVNYQMDTTAATPSPTIFGEHLQTLGIISGQLHMLAVTCRPGSSQMRLGSEKPQSHKLILLYSPVAESDSILIQDTKPVEPVCCYPSMKHP